MCSVKRKWGSDRRKETEWEIVRESRRRDGRLSLLACVLIMGCLLSRRRQGDGGMETAVPLLPRKQDKCWTLKKMTFLHGCVHIYSACAVSYSWEQTFPCAENWAEETSWQRDTFFWRALSLWHVLTQSILSHSEASEIFRGHLCWLSAKTEAPAETI